MRSFPGVARDRCFRIPDDGSGERDCGQEMVIPEKETEQMRNCLEECSRRRTRTVRVRQTLEMKSSMSLARWRAMSRQRLFFIVCAVLLFGSSVYGQSTFAGLSESWRWQWFGTESGVPPGVVDAILETPRRELWILTRAGMAWYNGYYWQSPPANPQLKSFMGAILESDSSGVLLNVQSLLFRVDHNGYHPVPLLFDQKPLNLQRIVSIGKQGLLLQSGTRLYLMHDGKIRHFPSPLDDPATGRIGEGTFGILHTRSDAPLLNAPGGLYRWKDDRWTILVPVKGDCLTNVAMCEDAAGNGIMSARIGMNLQRLEWRGDGTVVSIPLLPGEITRTLDCDGRGNTVVLRQSGEVETRTARGWAFLEPIPPELLGATTFHFDHRGDLWVSKTNGVYLCRLSSNLWSRLVDTVQGAVNTVNTLMFASDSTLWVGTSDGILVYRDNRKERQISTMDGKRFGIITGLAQDRNGCIWASSGSSFGGAWRFDGTSWKHFGAREGFSDNGVHRIVRDTRGRLWFLTSGFFTPGLYPELEDGAFIYDGSQFERIDTRDGLPDRTSVQCCRRLRRQQVVCHEQRDRPVGK